MPLFALPVRPDKLAPPPRSQYMPQPSRKRKRKRTSSPTPSLPSSDDDNDEKDLPESDRPSPSLPPALTNPLSLTPSEIIQYQLAGLDLDKVLPSKSIPNFPHRPLPPDYEVSGRKPKRKSSREGSGFKVSFANDEEQVAAEAPVVPEKKQREKGSKLKMHHFGVLTTVLHKCLHDGDIPRALRAFGLLIRTEVGGHEMDLRESGYWGIGAELLMRSQDKDPRGKGKGREGEVDSDSGTESEDGRYGHEKQGSRKVPEKRWGSTAGLEKVKEYYERLILQHPYMRQYHNSVTALDFWPALLGCEIYDIQYRRKEELWKIDVEEEKDEDNYGRQSEGSDDDNDNEDGDSRHTWRRFRRREARWLERDQVRQKTLEASQKLATRMDENLLSSLPYSDSHVLLRLRGMLALYIGDLSVPALPDPEEEKYIKRSRRDPTDNWRIRDRKFLLEQRRKDHMRGKQVRNEERARAKGLFERIERDGGRVDGVNLRDLSPEPEDEVDAIEVEDDSFQSEEVYGYEQEIRPRYAQGSDSGSDSE